MKICRFEGCGRKARAKDLCGTHYVQQSKGQELRPIRTKAQRLCSISGCEDRVEYVSDDLCRRHYRRKRYDPEGYEYDRRLRNSWKVEPGRLSREEELERLILEQQRDMRRPNFTMPGGDDRHVVASYDKMLGEDGFTVLEAIENVHAEKALYGGRRTRHARSTDGSTE